MKKIIASILCAVLLMVLMVPITASAESAGVSGSTTATAGKTVTVSISLNGTNIKGAQASISFDSSKLTYSGISSALSGWRAEYSNGQLVVYDDTGEGQFTGTKTVAKVTFNIPASASGTANVSLSNIILTDTDYNAINAGSASHSIAITATSTTTKPTTTKPTTTKPGATKPGATKPTTTKPTTTASTAANLKSLAVNGYTISPSFSQGRTSYTVLIPKDVAGLDVTAIPLNSDSEVTITGNKNFTPGASTTIKVLVKAADGTTKTYTIRTVFEEEATTQVVKLTDLKIKSVKDYQINFSPDVYDYTIKVPNGTNALNVQALIDEIEGARVEVVGADDLASNGNKVLIRVAAPDGTITEYTINVEFEDAASSIPGDIDDKKSGVPVWLLILLLLIAFVAGGFLLGYVIYVAMAKRNNSDDDDDDDDIGSFTVGSNSFAQSADD